MLFSAVPSATAEEGQTPAAVLAGTAAEWNKIHTVFSHPRWTARHAADDRPRRSDAPYGVFMPSTSSATRTLRKSWPALYNL
jgi:hypothetical protein